MHWCSREKNTTEALISPAAFHWRFSILIWKKISFQEFKFWLQLPMPLIQCETLKPHKLIQQQNFSFHNSCCCFDRNIQWLGIFIRNKLKVNFNFFPFLTIHFMRIKFFLMKFCINSSELIKNCGIWTHYLLLKSQDASRWPQRHR